MALVPYGHGLYARLHPEETEPEACPDCGCPGEQFDGHACEDFGAGICMGCGDKMDLNPMHPWCSKCSDDDE